MDAQAADTDMLTVSIFHDEQKGAKCSRIPKPVLDKLGNPPSLTFSFEGDKIVVLAGGKSAGERPRTEALQDAVADNKSGGAGLTDSAGDGAKDQGNRQVAKGGAGPPWPTGLLLFMNDQSNADAKGGSEKPQTRETEQTTANDGTAGANAADADGHAEPESSHGALSAAGGVNRANFPPNSDHSVADRDAAPESSFKARDENKHVAEPADEPELHVGIKAGPKNIDSEEDSRDGAVGPADGNGSAAKTDGKPVLSHGEMRICMRLNVVAKTVESFVICKINKHLDAVLCLEGGLVAERYDDEWSSPLTSVATRKPLDASLLDWSEDTTIRSTTSNYQFVLRGHHVRIFRDNQELGLVDTPELQRGRPFYLCYRETAWSDLRRWVTEHCKGFRDLDIASGLPQSWRLARIEAAMDDKIIRNKFPALAFPQTASLQLVGGIRVSGNQADFFSFAPPRVKIASGGRHAAAYCNGKPLRPPGDDGTIPLPDGLPVGSKILVRLISDQGETKKSLTLKDDFELPREPAAFVNRMGATLESGEGVSIAGARVVGHNADKILSIGEILEDLESEVGKIQFLLGSGPGQIVAWRSEELAGGWMPEWIIAKCGKKRQRVAFVGGALGGALPAPVTGSTLRKVKEWKDVVWGRRKRTVLPTDRGRCRQWREIQEAAKRA